mgnify:CR=1 FL=1
MIFRCRKEMRYECYVTTLQNTKKATATMPKVGYNLNYLAMSGVLAVKKSMSH